MPDISTNLSLPFIEPSQAQKHVTHNEGMRRLDTLVQLSVLSATQATPPVGPLDGERYILPAGVTGVWGGHEGDLASFVENSWVFYVPQTGWGAWVVDEDNHQVFDGTDWVVSHGLPDFQNLDHLGVATTADATNRLAVSSPATLLTHAGAGHQLKLNKAAPSDTASLLFQTNWSGCAEMGTAGSDNFEIKVSDDGVTFHQSLVADAATGRVSFPSGTQGIAPSEFGDGALITTAYSASKGAGMVANSTGLLGNSYNYPASFTYDPVVTPNLPASFCFSGYHGGLAPMEETIAVDPNQVFRLESYLRQEGLPGDWSAYTNEERHRHYMGVLCLDIDGFVVRAWDHMRYRQGGVDSMTTLSAPLTPGDTVVHLTDASGWNDTSSASHHRGIIVFGYKNAAGKTYSHYSRINAFDLFNLGQVDKVANTVTLKAPWPTNLGNPDDPFGVWPTGTPLANCSNGGTYKYSFYAGSILAETDRWYRSQSYMGGVDYSGTNVPSNFPPGTALVKPFWLPNYTNRSGGYATYPDTGTAHKVWYTGVSVMPEPLARMEQTAVGSQAIKVPVSDFATGVVSLASPVSSIDAV